jgi:hypothetical protein
MALKKLEMGFGQSQSYYDFNMNQKKKLKADWIDQDYKIELKLREKLVYFYYY